MTTEKTYTKEEVMQMMNDEILRDRMISFLKASLRWASQSGMPPDVFAAGDAMLARLVNPPQAPVPEAVAEKKED